MPKTSFRHVRMDVFSMLKWRYSLRVLFFAITLVAVIAYASSRVLNEHAAYLALSRFTDVYARISSDEQFGYEHDPILIARQLAKKQSALTYLFERVTEVEVHADDLTGEQPREINAILQRLHGLDRMIVWGGDRSIEDLCQSISIRMLILIGPNDCELALREVSHTSVSELQILGSRVEPEWLGVLKGSNVKWLYVDDQFEYTKDDLERMKALAPGVDIVVDGQDQH